MNYEIALIKRRIFREGRKNGNKIPLRYNNAVFKGGSEKSALRSVFVGRFAAYFYIH